MNLHDGTWHVRLELDDGKVLTSSTDDLTLAQVDTVERVSGIPWALWDPRRSVRVAMALFVVLLIADGDSEDKALTRAQELPRKTLTGAFRWDPPADPLPTTGERTDPPA